MAVDASRGEPTTEASGGSVPTDSDAPGMISPQDLADLMHSFNGVAERLQATQGALKAEVERLQEELRETNEQLRRSRALAALGQMAAGIAHEIRNPLGSIRLYASMLFNDLEDRPENRRMANRIEQATVEMDAIVRDVLTFAQQNDPQLVPMDAEVLVRQAVDSCVSLFHGRAIEIRWELKLKDAAARMVLVDPGLMNQALGNVIRNGLEAMGDGGILVIEIRGKVPGEEPIDGSVESESGGVELLISDNGPGLAAENMENIFNPFFTTKASGTGLGLAITHRIIDAHGGEISVTNGREGGVCVRIGLRPAKQVVTPDVSSISEANSNEPTLQALDAP